MDTFSIATITSDTYNYLIRTDVSFIEKLIQQQLQQVHQNIIHFLIIIHLLVGPTPNADYPQQNSIIFINLHHTARCRVVLHG